MPHDIDRSRLLGGWGTKKILFHEDQTKWLLGASKWNYSASSGPGKPSPNRIRKIVQVSRRCTNPGFFVGGSERKPLHSPSQQEHWYCKPTVTSFLSEEMWRISSPVLSTSTWYKIRMVYWHFMACCCLKYQKPPSTAIPGMLSIKAYFVQNTPRWLVTRII